MNKEEKNSINANALKTFIQCINSVLIQELTDMVRFNKTCNNRSFPYQHMNNIKGFLEIPKKKGIGDEILASLPDFDFYKNIFAGQNKVLNTLEKMDVYKERASSKEDKIQHMSSSIYYEGEYTIDERHRFHSNNDELIVNDAYTGLKKGSDVAAKILLVMQLTNNKRNKTLVNSILNNVVYPAYYEYHQKNRGAINPKLFYKFYQARLNEVVNLLGPLYIAKYLHDSRQIDLSDKDKEKLFTEIDQYKDVVARPSMLRFLDELEKRKIAARDKTMQESRREHNEYARRDPKDVFLDSVEQMENPGNPGRSR